MSEIANELPDNWAWSTLGEVCEHPQYGWTTKASRQGNLHLLRTTDITSGEINWNTVPYCVEEPGEKEKYMLKDGDIVVSRAGSVGVSYLISNPEPSVFASYLIRFKPLIDRKYVYYFLKSPAYWNAISEKSAGIALQNVNASKLKEIKIPIAPPDQQKLIVAKIEELFSHIDAGIIALKKAKRLLKLFRKSILKAAVTGELTEEWRKANKNLLEPASILLERVLNGRRKKWEEQQSERFQVKGKITKNDKWKEKYKEPKVNNVTEIVELPSGWIWVATELLAKDKENSLGAGPFGTIFKKRDFRANGVPIIFLRHVKAGRYITAKPTYMDQKKWNDLFVPYSVFGGEILVTKLGDPPGEAAIYPNNIGPAMVTPDVIKLDVNCEIVEPEFVMNFYNSEISTTFISELAFGTTRLRVTLPIFKSLPVPIPPLAEQREILRVLSESIGAASRVDHEIDIQLNKAKKNKQTILSLAFSGGLTDSLESDGDARSLLEQIQKTRAEKITRPEQKSKSMYKSRGVPMKRSIIEVLKEKKEMKISSLLVEAGYNLDEVEEFYEALSTISERIEEIRPAKKENNTWPYKNEIKIRLK